MHEVNVKMWPSQWLIKNNLNQYSHVSFRKHEPARDDLGSHANYSVLLYRNIAYYSQHSRLHRTLLCFPPLWWILFLSAGARLQSATVATVWPCWGLCQLQPTLCWLLFCAIISSYGAFSRPNCCTSPCTYCWLQESVSSSTLWTKATVPVSLRELSNPVKSRGCVRSAGNDLTVSPSSELCASGLQKIP